MMVTVTGVPGSGKTLYTTTKITEAILAGKSVATNVVLTDDWAERIAKTTILRLQPRRRRRRCAEWRRRLVYVNDVDALARVRLSTEGIKRGKLEGRGVAVLDEAGEWLDARAWAEDPESRKRTNRFFRQHRKLGWDVYLISQEAEMIDKQVRTLAEYEVRLRNLRHVKLLGVPVLPFNLFVALWAWHGVRSQRPAKKEFFRVKRRTAGMYDTHQIVHTVGEDDGMDSLLWLPLVAVAETAESAEGAPAGDDSTPAPPVEPETVIAA